MSATPCPYCFEEMDEPESVNGMYVFPWYCDCCGATETNYWHMKDNPSYYSPRERRVGFQFGGMPQPDAHQVKTLTLKEYLEELRWHANSSTK